MKQLVVLVGLPGSGKTSYQREHPDWVVVSRSAFRQTMFRCSFEAGCEQTVDRVFHAALVEAIDSPADVVCVDEPNLTAGARAPYVELARLSGRDAVAHVMPEIPVDAAYERLQRNLKRLALEKPYLRVRPFSRAAYDALAASYQPVDESEGFAAVERPAASEAFVARMTLPARPRARTERAPLPLFSA